MVSIPTIAAKGTSNLLPLRVKDLFLNYSVTLTFLDYCIKRKRTLVSLEAAFGRVMKAGCASAYFIAALRTEMIIIIIEALNNRMERNRPTNNAMYRFVIELRALIFF